MDDLEQNKKNFAILLVDDNLFTLGHRLQREGYTNIQNAKNGSEALSKIVSNSFDLVLLDLMMPDMSGKDVLEHIKSNLETSQTMVMMISGDSPVESAIDCIKLGAEDFYKNLSTLIY